MMNKLPLGRMDGKGIKKNNENSDIVYKTIQFVAPITWSRQTKRQIAERM